MTAPAEPHAPFTAEQLAVPAELPVAAAADALIDSIRQHPVTIVCGATGSGKSTQLPKLALRAGRQAIAHTQPRRLAARTLAERLASEMRCNVGAEVGWQVRFAQAVSEQTRVKLMTDGVLLSELRHDRQLRRYDTIILDEAHERSLNIDFLLGCLHRLLRRRRDLRLIITSATLDAEKFSRHFDQAPVFEVEGRSYPVEIRYQPPGEGDLAPAIAEALRSLWREGPGDALVFLPGEREIRELRDALPRQPALSRHGDAEFLPLYARLPAAQQQRIFAPRRSGRRVILATNVAETSLTVPGIRYVIDSGLARIARYSPRTQLQSLAVEPVAQDACQQRAGRCGRTAPGICIRLYEEEDFAARPPETAPEILRSNLADVVLQMADRRLGEPENFPFVDPPERRLLRDARRLLQQLQALREDGQPTPTGRKMARLPVEPRYARMLVEAARLNCLEATVVVVAALSMPDVREIPPEQREAARQAHATWRDQGSDFATLLALHTTVQAARAEHGRSAYERWCREHFLSPRRVREWQDLIHQLHRELRAAGFERRSGDATALHRALLVGLLDHIGQHHENGDYRGPRGSQWRIHPESTLRRARPNWVFAASLVSTRQTYGRNVAATDAATICAAAGPLLQRSALDPAWDAKRGEAMCTEQCRLFGLIVDASRRVPLSRHDPEAARELLLREGLAAGRWGPQPQPEFLRHNQRIVAQIRQEEERLRRRDLLPNEEQRAELYAAVLPAEILSCAQLLDWLREHEDRPLRWTVEQLQAGSLNQLREDWPTQIALRGQRLDLRYRFAPGDADDGITVLLPLEALSQLRDEDFVGRVPGLAEQQMEALLRALPKADRRALIPLADTVAALRREIEPGPGFLAQLRGKLEARLGHPLPAAALALDGLPDKLRLRYALRAPREPGKRRGRGAPREQAAGRDLAALRAAHAAPAREAAEAALDLPELPTALQRFPETAPQWQQRSPRGTPLRLILRDRGPHVDLAVAGDPVSADAEHAAGLRRLAWLRMKSRIALRLKPLKSLRALRHTVEPPAAPWPELLAFIAGPAQQAPSLTEAVGLQALGDTAPLAQASDRGTFEAAVDALWPQVDRRLQAAVAGLERAEPQWEALRLSLATQPADSPLRHAAGLLMHPQFVACVDDWAAFPRYLEALAARADKRRRSPGPDHDREAQLRPFEERLLATLQQQRPPPAHALRALHWALQDYRVSLFAQELGVPHAVSPKRLNKLFLDLNPA